MAKKSRIKSSFSRAGSILGLKSIKDVGEVAITSAGSNYFANVIATATSMQNHRYVRPLIAGVLSYFISRRNLRTATLIGSVLIALSQAGFNIPILSNMSMSSGGTNNPQRGQQTITSMNTLGRLP
tara:strand:+ start:1208 stop:1585 length:378 start_codon:yes stop_codon:yes gene_type:complete